MSALMNETIETKDMQMLSNAHDWQAHAFTEWLSKAPEAWKYGHVLNRMTIKAITGSGKTYLSVMIIQHHMTQPNARIVIVVPSKGLLKQWYEILSGWNIANVSRCGDGHKYDRHSPIVVVTKHSLKKLRGAKNLMKGNTLYVLDECHNMASPKTYDVLDDMGKIGMMQKVIGVSATPARTDGRNIMDLTGSNSEGLPHITYGYADALADETVIPKFTIHVGRFSQTLLMHETYQPVGMYDNYAGNKLDVLLAMTKNIETMAASLSKKLYEFGGAPPSAYNSSGGVNLIHHWWGNANNTYDLAEQVNAWKHLCIKRKRLLNTAEYRYTIALDFVERNIGIKQAIYHESIAGVEKLAQMIRESGLGTPYIYHSGESVADWDELTHAEKQRLAEYKKNSKEILQQWMRSDSGILLTVQALKEGLDVPDMGAVLILSHPNAPRPTIQTLGRALRGERDDDGRFIQDKHIWIINCDVKADDRCIANIKKEGEIPEDCFRYYNRSNDGWIETGNVAMAYEVSDDASGGDHAPTMTQAPTISSVAPTMSSAPTMTQAPTISSVAPTITFSDAPTIKETLVFNVVTGEMQPASSAQGK